MTRDEEGDGPLTRALGERGARVIHWPVIAAAPPEDPAALADAVGRLDGYDWVVFTSRRAVDAVAAHTLDLPAGLRVAVVGEGTATAAEAYGWSVDLVPGEQTGAALAAAFQCEGLARGARILFLASELARDTLPDGLARAGATVERVTAYRMVPSALDRAACRRVIEAEEVDVVTVTSPSSGENLGIALGAGLFGELAARVPFAAIGPTTAEALRGLGVKMIIEAAEHSFDGLADAVGRWLADDSARGGR